jgi:hypothetical protein
MVAGGGRGRRLSSVLCARMAPLASAAPAQGAEPPVLGPPRFPPLGQGRARLAPLEMQKDI